MWTCGRRTSKFSLLWLHDISCEYKKKSNRSCSSGADTPDIRAKGFCVVLGTKLFEAYNTFKSVLTILSVFVAF